MQTPENKNIRELEKELTVKLADYGADYQTYLSTWQGDKRINGFHVDVLFPVKMTVSRAIVAEVRQIIETYFGEVRDVKSETSSFGTRENKKKVLTFYFVDE